MHRPPPASLSQRALAAAIDVVAGMVVSMPVLVVRQRKAATPSRVLDVVAFVARGAVEVTATCVIGQTLGQRIVGIRVADHATFALPTLRQAVVRSTVTALPDAGSMLVRRWLAPRENQAIEAMKELETEVHALREQHGGDQRSLNEALIRLYHERGVKPTQGCGPVVARELAALLGRAVLLAPAVRSPLRQGLHDRVSGTVVVAGRR